MVTTTKKQFKVFINECNKWIERFGLSHYRINYDHVKLDRNGSSGAKINYDAFACVATIRLNTEIDDDYISDETIKLFAKHEATHLLLANLMENAENRFASQHALHAAEEDLVRKLESLL